MTSNRMNSSRKIALVTGVLFVITYVTSIPPVLFLYAPLLRDPRYIVGAGADNGVLWGAFLELRTQMPPRSSWSASRSSRSMVGRSNSDLASSSASGTGCCWAT